jgi:hypothetical protein
MHIGEQNLGAFAREQLDAARRDPRLGMGRGAMVADFWAAIEEAERVRTLGVWGLYELQQTLKREKQRLAAAPNDPTGPIDPSGELQALWERAELARAELASGHPALNAQALISMNSALDALVEEFVPAMRDLRVRAITAEAIQRAEENVPEVGEQLTPELREKLLEALRNERTLPKLKQLRGSGIERYEARLHQAGLGAPDDRPIPEDLDQALQELGALRDVLVHRAGRVDERAREQAPSLRYEDGELVRISDDEYRTYSAAVRCYAGEVTYRPVRHWPEASDEENGPNLANWHNYYVIGA